ncbi:MAG: Helix-turn-helix domain protein [Candidatus Woesebacteria bacterium GW2011_GWF1_40_24]|uniref:Helix-turn-helix domain protein n=1 Tax=Candidatus Woesebacteria bacterium GW2011_GWF1_40_24 TaxID=1618601 RepID=A0A0G0RUD1_9BACT|nr:MAG: Helix-turn-helix domain protein [Candidatus Woesebacteria bacterium GW2011_GWF1_40_24]
MKYSSLGKLVEIERKKRGWEQSELAIRLQRKQQTISRWEHGDSRPALEDLLKLIDLFSVDRDIWFAQAGYEQEEEPDISLAPYLPLQNLGSEKFESFCKAVITALNPNAEVERYGTQGFKQEGIDLFSRDKNEVLDYQCKRHKQFGPADVKKAINATTFKAKHHYILLSRNASPLAKKEILNYPNWSLWDREDISEKIRNLANKDDAVRIVDTFFPGKRKSFLGIDEPSPWLTVEQFFLPFESRSKLFSHGWALVGRQNNLQQLKEFEKSELQAIILSGRGGIGKSRLLKAWSESVDKSIPIRFVSSGTNIEAKHLELLPSGVFYLVIDDAHERNDILVILGGVVRLRPEAKIILVSRLYGVAKLEDELTRSGINYDTNQIIKLNDLRVEEAENLSIEILSDPEVKGDVSLAKRIAIITKDCPLATVIGSRLVGKGLIRPELLNNEKEFRKALLSSFRDVIAGEVGGKNSEDVRLLLDFLATIQPFNISDPAFKSAVESVLNRHFDLAIRDINALEEAGVLLMRGNNLRVVPDLLADYIRFETSYDEKNNHPTGYVDRIFDSLDGDLAIHLLVNVSQLDWRLSADNVQSTLLDAVWEKVFGQIKASNNADRATLLKKLKDTAYYQPKQLLRIVEEVIDKPSKVAEDPKLVSLYKYEYKDVLKELPEILRRISYNLEYLPHCVDLIWEIGRGDSRRTNQYPEHGIRVLQELAQYDVYELTGKGIKVNEMMLEAIKRWLDDKNLENYIHSPLDVLDELLDKDSVTDVYDKGKITFHSFGVNYENTKHLREEALKLVIECAKSSKLKISLRAIKSLSHALEQPRSLYGRLVSDSEMAKWESFQLSVLDEIEKIIKVQTHPIIFMELKSILAWHAHYSHSEEIKKRARALFETLSKSFEGKLVQAVGQIWDRDWLIDEEKYDHDKLTEMSLKFRQEMANGFMAKYPDVKKGFAELEELLKALESNGKNPFPISFFGEMAKLNPKYVEGLSEEVLKNKESVFSKHFGYLLFALVDKNPKKTAILLHEALKTNQKELCVAVADYYWRARWLEHLDEKNDIQNIKQLLESEHEFVKKLALGSLGRLGKVKPDIAKKLLLEVDLKTSKELADEYCQQFDKEHYFDPDILSENELQKVLEKFEKIDDIDDYYIEEFLDYAGTRMPIFVVDLLLKRIKRAGEVKKRSEYQALSYSSRKLLQGFSKTKQYVDVLRMIRNIILEKEWQTRFWIPKLFKSVSNNFDDISLNVLLEWVHSGDKDKLEGVGIIIEDAPENFVFTNPKFVSEMLLVAKPFGSDTLKSARNALAHSTVFRSKHGTPGQPMVEDVELKEKCEKVLPSFSLDSLEHELYSSLLKYANHEIETHTKDDDEIWD